MEKLAINGGTPVRTTEFPSNFLGGSVIDNTELKELADVVSEKSPFRHYGLGNPTKVANFEKNLRDYYGRKFVLGVSSGSAALCCAMVALGLGPGDEVILSAFTWFSDYMALVNLGITPVFAEIDETLDLDPYDFEKKITPNTKAVIVVDFQGGAAKMEEICRIAKEHNIKIIEDCAQAMGGRCGDKLLGTFGDIAISSFQMHKVLTSGDGGVLMMDNEEYFARAVRYHDLGMIREHFADQITNKELLDDEKYCFAGLQFRMSELTGAFLCAQFSKMETILANCRKSHKMIREHFANSKNYKIRYTEGDCGMAIFMMFATAAEADRFKECMCAEGINVGAASACCNMLHEYPIKSRKMAHPAMAPFGKGCAGENVTFDENACPVTDEILARNIAISLGPLYTEADVNDIIKAIEKVEANLYA